MQVYYPIKGSVIFALKLALVYSLILRICLSRSLYKSVRNISSNEKENRNLFSDKNETSTYALPLHWKTTYPLFYYCY